MTLFKRKTKCGFTLAEVLITLGVIGIIAAMTLPSLINKAQNMILRNQYKKAYAIFFNAIKLVQAQNDAPIACLYWSKNTYQSPVCESRNEYGTCSQWVMPDGSALPSDYNGLTHECTLFRQKLFETLNVVTYCPQNALAKGCITDKYKGIDKVKKENNPSSNPDPNEGFTDTNIKKIWPAWILADGTTILGYGYTTISPVYTIDINGKKSPNKWGCDIFSFKIYGDKVNGITQIKPVTYATEKGCLSGEQFFNDNMLK